MARPWLPGLLAAGALAGAAPDAAATLVAVAFEGEVRESTDAVPGGPVEIGAPFSGTLVYDSSAEDLDASEPIGSFVYDEGPVGLTASVAGVSYATDPDAVAFTVAIESIFWDTIAFAIVDAPNPDNPRVRPAQLFEGTSESNLPLDGLEYSLAVSFVQNVHDSLEPPFPEIALLDSAAALADVMRSGRLTIAGSDGSFELTGRITSATPIPEPSTGLLLLAGCAWLARRPRPGLRTAGAARPARATARRRRAAGPRAARPRSRRR